MASKRISKMTRQLQIYDNILSTTFHGPNELMKTFRIGKRMLQRDLKDLRDAGVINVKYDAKTDNYIESKKEAVFDETATGRHREHLVRLSRLCTLIDRLPRTDMVALQKYESAMEDYEFYIEYMDEDPENFPGKYMPDLPVMPELDDIKAAYYDLFPDSYEQKRRRDFKALNDAGFEIYYDRRYRVFIFDELVD